MFLAFPEYVLTAVDGFTLNDKRASTTLPNSDMSDEQIQGHWEIQARNELIVTQHQSSSSSDEDSDGDDDAGDIDQYNTEGKKKKKKKKNIKDQQNEEQVEEGKKKDKNFNPFTDIKDYYGGHSTKLVILPRFPQNHRLAVTQRSVVRSIIRHFFPQ